MTELRVQAFFEAAVKTPVNLKVFFEYRTEGGRHGKFFLGEIPGRERETSDIRIESRMKKYLIGNIRDFRENGKRGNSLQSKRLYKRLNRLEAGEGIVTILAFDHLLGGGASEYLEEKKRQSLQDGKRFLTVRQDMRGPTYYLAYEYGRERIEYLERNLDEVLEEIRRVDEIWVNELVTYVKPYEILRKIVAFKEKHHAHLKMLLHDFYGICPAVNLLNEKGVYCKAAAKEVCNCCIPKNRSNACPEYESGTAWRENWRRFLGKCDEIVAFSEDTRRLFQKVYPELDNYRLIPHRPHDVAPVKKERKTTDTLNIGLLGVLSYTKGLGVVKELVRYIEKEKLQVRIRLIGIPDEEIESPVFSYTGRYSLEQLPGLTVEQDIDVFLIASVWPETYSYTTSEVISMGMPVAVFPIGAPVERVQKYEKGIILSGTDPETVLRELQTFASDILHR